MNKNIENKILYEVRKLVEVMEILRGPDGCPWDRKQDYYSLKENIIEEAYEVVEALEEKDIEALKEELGDLLLQVIFQAQIAHEIGDFDLGDISRILREKLIRRHPHVFADTNVENVEEVLIKWEEIKKTEKESNNNSLMEDLNQGQTALNQSFEIQEIASEVGFDWDDINLVIEKIEEELEETKEAVDENDKNKLEEEIGDLLFSVVNLARFKNINPEISLFKTILKFKSRFKYIEEQINLNKGNINDYTLDELDKLWNKAKKSFEEDKN